MVLDNLHEGVKSGRPVQFKYDGPKKKSNESAVRTEFFKYVKNSPAIVHTARMGQTELSKLILEKRPGDVLNNWHERHIWNGHSSETETNPLVEFMELNKDLPQAKVFFLLKEVAKTCSEQNEEHGAVVPNVHGTGDTTDEGPLHYDDYFNFMFVLYGQKTFLFCPPDHITSNKKGKGSPNELTDWKPEQVREGDSEWSCVQLNAGDGMFLPPRWWHYVTTKERSLMANWFVEAPFPQDKEK